MGWSSLTAQLNARLYIRLRCKKGSQPSSKREKFNTIGACSRKTRNTSNPRSLRRRVLDGCASRASPRPWPSLCMTRQRLGSSWSSSGVNISTLQDSLGVTDCWFAPRSPGETSLQHTQSPGGTGRLLRDLLAVITTGLAPVSHRCLAGHTTRCRALFVAKTWDTSKHCLVMITGLSMPKRNTFSLRPQTGKSYKA
jgi:hypothetical protein